MSHINAGKSGCEDFIETGYLADPASIDLGSASKCNVIEVLVDKVSYPITLAANWTVTQLVNAVNAITPGTLSSSGSTVASATGKTISNLEIICELPDFVEGFVDPTAGQYLDLASGTVNPGATTSYTFFNDGGFLGPSGIYAIGRASDLRFATTDPNTDYKGDPNGGVLAVNGDATPGDFYKQTANGLVIGQEYEFSAWIGTGAFIGPTVPGPYPVNESPDVTLRIETTAGTLIDSVNTGPITIAGWTRYNIKFVAANTEVNYILRNNSGVIGGNDLIMDEIHFSRISRQHFTLLPRERVIPVEIHKQICDGVISIRQVVSSDTTTVYPIPDPSGMVLSVGSPTIDTGTNSSSGESTAVSTEVLCDDNGEFYRWFVKDNGEPTGVSYDTDLSGAPYVPVGAVVECSDPTITLLPVCDVLTAVIGGTVPYTFATPYNVAIDYSTVTLTNDTVLFYWTDFGTGYSDVGPSPDHTYEADGHYEIKSYAVTASGNKILIAAKEITILAGVVTVNGANPHVVNRSYSISVGSAMQEYSGTTPVGTPINPDGSAYTVQGTLAWSCPIVIDELEDNAEWNPENVADLVECEVLSGGGVVTEGLDANLNAISTLLGIPTPDNRHILLGNTLSISSTGSSNVMAAGLNVAATGLITGAQFTFNIDLIADSDPGDPADFGVVVWDNVAGTSVLATSITAPFPMSYDPQGSGLNFPIYANPVAPQSFQVVWTGDLPAGDYTVGFILQDQNAGIGADSVNLSVTHNITAGNTTTTKAQLVALDQCTINALTPEPVVAPIEVPNGRIIINPASMSVIVGSSLVRSFSVRGLDNAKYNISFDNSATWLTDIDGGDSWGEGNEDNLNISQVVIQPTVSGDRVFIHWETI